MLRRQVSRKVVLVVVLLAVIGAGAVGAYRLRDADRTETTAPPLIATVPGLGRFVIRDGRDLIQSHLLAGRPWEPEAIRVFTQHVTAGMHVADFGAYNGVHSIRLARLVGRSGRVYAFEPNPPAYDMLKENIRLNGLEDRIIAYPYALGDRAVSARIGPSTAAHNLGGASVCTDEDIRAHARGCGQLVEGRIETIRIDDDIARWFPVRVGFVKIDVEGYEDRVLAGAREWLKRDHPVIYVELWDDEKRRQSDLPLTRATVIAVIEGLGYRQAHHQPPWTYVFVPSR